jgi:predicted dehydrogenase
MVRAGVIGCGYWGPNHVRVLEEVPESQVVVAVDRDPIKLARLNEKFPHLRVERHYEELLVSDEVDAVVVATPTQTHYAIVRDFLFAGKHVLCEKPLCESTANARALIELAEERHLVLMTGHVFLFNKGIMALKEVIERNGLGRVRHVSAIRTNLGPIRHDVNAAYDLATHDIAIFNWLLNAKPIRVSACGAACLQSGIEDVVSLSLTYPRNIFATIHASWLSAVKARRICVVGDRQMAAWEDGECPAALTIYDKGAAAHSNGKTETEPIISIWNRGVHQLETPWVEPLKVQALHFLRRLRGPDTEAGSDGRFALDVVEVLEAACRSMKEGGAPIYLTGGVTDGWA